MTATVSKPIATPSEVAPVEASRGDSFSSRQRLVYIVMLGALAALGPFTIDLYLPAFPAVAADLHASDAAIQITLTATLIGFALGQLIVGPLADAFGRRKPLLIATSVHVLASVAIVFAPTVELVTVGRVFQGIGAAGSGVVAMAIVRDLFSGQRLIRMLSRLALVWGLAPVLAPVIGSQLLKVVEWRGIFVVLAGFGLLMMIVSAVFMVETLPAERRGAFSGRAIARRYRHLAHDRAFVGAAILGSMAFTALFGYLSSSSFVLQDIYGLSAQQFGLVFGINSLGLVAATQISARLMRRFAPKIVATAGPTRDDRRCRVADDLRAHGRLTRLGPRLTFLCGFPAWRHHAYGAGDRARESRGGGRHGRFADWRAQLAAARAGHAAHRLYGRFGLDDGKCHDGRPRNRAPCSMVHRPSQRALWSCRVA